MIREWWNKVGWRRGRGKTGGGVAVQEEAASQENSSSVVPLRKNPESAIVRKKDSTELFQEAVDKLVDRLEQINAGIAQRVGQNEQLLDRMSRLPEFLSSLPQQAQEQKEILQELAAELKDKTASEQKMVDSITGMTEQAVEQTRKLSDIREQLGGSAKTNRQLCDNMGRFGDSLDKLNVGTDTQVEWTQHLSRSLAATDQYLKMTLARQQSRFLWVFAISMAVCLTAIAGLVIGLWVFIK
jgi:regulator of replication initiation timing